MANFNLKTRIDNSHKEKLLRWSINILRDEYEYEEIFILIYEIHEHMREWRILIEVIFKFAYRPVLMSQWLTNIEQTLT